MGSTGAKKQNGNGFINAPTGDSEKYTVFDTPSGAVKWFSNPKLSNHDEWYDGLTDAEKSAIDDYTGSGYKYVNKDLFNTHWDEMSEYTKNMAKNLFSAINKFELKKGVNLTRKTDFKVFNGHHTIDSIKDYLSGTNGVLQHDGFTSAGADTHGTGVAGSGLVIHFKLPPSKGAGAFIAKLGVQGENEFLFNDNAVFKYDIGSLHKEGSQIHVNATWLGQAKKQSFDKKKKGV